MTPAEPALAPAAAGTAHDPAEQPSATIRHLKRAWALRKAAIEYHDRLIEQALAACALAEEPFDEIAAVSPIDRNDVLTRYREARTRVALDGMAANLAITRTGRRVELIMSGPANKRTVVAVLARLDRRRLRARDPATGVADASHVGELLRAGQPVLVTAVLGPRPKNR